MCGLNRFHIRIMKSKTNPRKCDIYLKKFRINVNSRVCNASKSISLKSKSIENKYQLNALLLSGNLCFKFEFNPNKRNFASISTSFFVSQ